MKTLSTRLFSALFITMLCLPLMTFVSCDEDEDEDEMIGTWSLFEADVTEGDQVITRTAEEAGISITVVFTSDTYTATLIETGVDPDIETGTWVRINSITVIITPIGDSPMTLIKEGAYYTYNDIEEGVKMKFRKL